MIVLLGNGKGSFRKLPAIRNLPVSLSLAVQDFNGDGNQDVAMADQPAGLAELTLLRGKGDGSFQPAENFGGPAGADRLAVGDFNHDGAPDVALVGIYAIQSSVSVALNTSGNAGHKARQRH